METQTLLKHNKSKSYLPLTCKIILIVIILMIVSYFVGKQALVEPTDVSTIISSTTTSSTATSDSKRILIYYSPNEDESNDLDLIDIIKDENLNPSTKSPYITHIEISTLHLKQFDDNIYIHLNDFRLNHPRFIKLRQNILKLKEQGVKVLFMMGGWEGIDGDSPKSDSSFINLFENWDDFYPKLVQLFKEWNIDGLDIDIENCYDNDYNLVRDNYENVVKLIKNLKCDLGDSFIISLSPVAEAIFSDDEYGGLSGFNYKSLVLQSDDLHIDFLNLQFYDGWGSLDNIKQYEQCINEQGYDANMLIAGMLNVDEMTSDKIKYTIKRLVNQYGDDFGGIFVYNGNSDNTVTWSKKMYNLMHQ